MSLGTEINLGPGNIVLDEELAPPPPKNSGHSNPLATFWPMCRGHTAGWIKMSLGTEVGLGPGYNVLDADLVLAEKGHSASKFSAHVYCGQTAEWIKMPLGAEVVFGSGHNVLDGDPALPNRGTAPLLFGPWLLWPNG